MKKLQKLLFPCFLLLTGINVFFASWSVLHNDIVFISDIARDMFLLQEIAEKKLVLIGPRSSVLGLFHGPLWTYVNFPAYLFGNGNPVIIGWYWILLVVGFLVSCYFIAKKLFNQYAAMLYVLFMSLYLAFYANAFFNPYGALLVIPACFYFFIRYIETQKAKNLAFHLILIGFAIQFQMAVGVPLLILSFLYVAVFAFKKKHLKHIFIYLLIPVLLSNFIVFDVRHEFLLSNNVVRHLGTFQPKMSFFDLVYDRIDHILNHFTIMRFGPPNGQFYFMSIFFIFLFLQFRHKVHKKIYATFAYFFFGFFVLSLINRYGLLDFYVFPLFSLLFLIFGSFITGKHKKLFLGVFSVIYVLNLIGLVNHVNGLNNYIGKDKYSWKGLYTAASQAYQGEEKEFGYFVYAPDVLGYGPRYAMEYAKKVYRKNGYAFEKKPITYLLVEPAAENNQYTSEKIFKLHKAHFYSTPVKVWNYPNGYKLEKHVLNEAKGDYLPFDPGINPGLSSR